MKEGVWKYCCLIIENVYYYKPKTGKNKQTTLLYINWLTLQGIKGERGDTGQKGPPGLPGSMNDDGLLGVKGSPGPMVSIRTCLKQSH